MTVREQRTEARGRRAENRNQKTDERISFLSSVFRRLSSGHSHLKRTTSLSLIFCFLFVTLHVEGISWLEVKKAFAQGQAPSSTAGGLSNLQESANIQQSYHTDLFTGRAQFSVPIFTPPGRRGLTPQVSLSYSSGSGASWVGTGWNLDHGFIQRSLKKGVPAYNDSQDTFTFMIQGVNSDLVKIGDNEYHAKDESGEFLKFMYENEHWVVYDKSGTQYTFGESEQAKARNTKGIFCWCLEKVKDVYGNTISYIYAMDQGEMYIERIDYNGNEDQNFPATHSVHFITEPRPDVTFAYNTGVKVTTAKRLKTIEVRVAGQLSRLYNLTYEQSPIVGRSRLQSIQECGTDGTACLPAQTFGYQNGSFEFSTTPEVWAMPNPTGEDKYKNIKSSSSSSETSGLYDLNGDGLLDRVITDSNANNEWKVYQNSGTGFSSQPILWPVTVSAGNAAFKSTHLWSAEGTYASLTDFNQDGFPDRLFTNPSIGGDYLHLFINQNGNGFNSQEIPIYSLPRIGTYFYITEHLGGSTNTESDFIDLTGDGLLERVVKDGSSNQWRVYLIANNAISTTPAYWNLPNPGGSEYQFLRSGGDYYEDAGLYDLNGDGLADRVVASSNYSDGWKVYFNNGAGFDPGPSIWPVATNGNANFRRIQSWAAEGSNMTLLDLNGDGLLDRAFIDPSTCPNCWNIWMYPNTGSGFLSTPIIWTSVPRYGTYAYIQERTDTQNTQSDFLDLNGDGLVERVVRDGSSNQWKVYRNMGETPDLLKSVSNGRGGMTAFEYTPSTRFDNRDLSGTYRLPFPVHVVTKVTNSDGMGNNYVTNISYKGGMYDSVSREFRGFREVTVKDAQNTETINTFHQDEHWKGRSLRTEVKDSSGNLFTKTENTWDCIHPYSEHPDIHFTILKQTDQFLYDGDSSFKQSRKRFDYDGTNGNMLTAYDDGDPDTMTDDRKQTTEYAMNPDLHIMNAVAKTSAYDADNQLINEKYFYYDSHANITDIPTKGALTKQEDLLAAGSLKPTTQMSYDSFGNLMSVTDAMNKTTVNEYDPIFKLYLVKVTNALGHAQEFTYNPLIAQITEIKDQNNQISRTIHDPLGRVIKTISPYDSEATPAQYVLYDDVSFPNRVVTKLKTSYGAPSVTNDDQPQTGYLTTYSFMDGLGREIQKRTPAEDPNQQIVSGSVTFDNRGQLKEQYVPYLASFRTTYAALPSSIPHASFTYDAVGRRTRVDYPDLTFSTVQYNDFVKTVTDPRGHSKRYTQDTFGNLIQVEEFNQNETYVTHYEYDPLNRLIKTTNHLGHITTVQYDLLGRKTSMTDPNMGHWTYQYDKNNNLLSQTDAKNQTIVFEYDSLNRLIKKTYPDTAHIDYTYDSCPSQTCGGLSGENHPVGRLLKVEDQSGIHLFRYDKLGRVIQDEKSPDDGQNYSFTRIYDPQGRVTSLEYPDGDILNLSFNLMGEVETMNLVTLPSSIVPLIQNVNYNASGQITRIEYGNGVVSDYSYNPQTLRLEHLLTSRQSQALQDFTYQFDGNGNVLNITDAINTNTQAFQYDDLDRLTQAIGSYGTHTFQYNAIGNMTSKAGATLSYNDPLHPQAVTTHLAANNAITNYQYDLNGNMKKRGQDTLIYDYDNRLIAIQKPSIGGGCAQAQGNMNVCMEHLEQENQTAQSAYYSQYVYDASGQRVKKEAQGKTTYYLGKDYEVEYNSTGSLKRKAFFLGDTRVAELEVQGTQGSVPHLRFFHGDHLGSTNLVTNEQGQQTLLMEYLPYGEIKRMEGTDKVQNTFTGQKSDFESGLMYYNARYYDPKVGRFISADSIVPNASDPQELNRYSYVNNNPVKYTDPTGHKKKKRSWWKKAFAAWIGFNIGVAVTILTGGNAALGFMAGTAAYRGLDAGLHGAKGREILTATLNGAAEGAQVYANPIRAGPGLISGDPKTDSLSSAAKNLIRASLTSLGMGQISAEITTRQIDSTLSSGRSFGEITSAKSGSSTVNDFVRIGFSIIWNQFSADFELRDISGITWGGFVGAGSSGGEFGSVDWVPTTLYGASTYLSLLPERAGDKMLGGWYFSPGIGKNFSISFSLVMSQEGRLGLRNIRTDFGSSLGLSKGPVISVARRDREGDWKYSGPSG